MVKTKGPKPSGRNQVVKTKWSHPMVKTKWSKPSGQTKWVSGQTAPGPGCCARRQHDTAGSILPGARREFWFSFKSDAPGVFSEQWRCAARR